MFQTILASAVGIVAVTSASLWLIHAVREAERYFKTLADNYETLANAAKDQANGLGTFVVNEDGKIQFGRFEQPKEQAHE